MKSFERRLQQAKRASTAQLLFRCARRLNERALESLPKSRGPRPRPAHMSLFPHIALDEGTRITELAGKLGVSKQAVGQLVDDLEGMGIVQRAADPADGRAKRVLFTPAGRQSMLDGLTHLRRIERQLARSIGKDVMQSLHDALLVLDDHLDESVDG